MKLKLLPLALITNSKKLNHQAFRHSFSNNCISSSGSRFFSTNLCQRREKTQLERTLEKELMVLALSTFGTPIEVEDLVKHPTYKYDAAIYKKGWDPEFNVKEFLDGASEAFRTVRELLVEDPLSLESMMTPIAFAYFKEWHKFINETHQSKVCGQAESIESAEIRNIRIRGDGAVTINVFFKVRESLYIEDVNTGELKFGTRDPKLNIALVSFFRHNNEEDWRIKALANPYSAQLDESTSKEQPLKE
ncbi:hypothetical protein ABK040_013389 [Willaertia magna]